MDQRQDRWTAEGVKGGLELVAPQETPPHSWRQKLTPQGTPLGELLRVEVESLRRSSRGPPRSRP
jgi:hypothetical protein